MAKTDQRVFCSWTFLWRCWNAKALFLLIMAYYISVRWWYGICSLLSPTNIALVYRLPAEFRNTAGIYPFFAWTSHFLLPRPMLAITYELCYASQCFFFFFLIRWISKIVAVQKLVVFFKKKTNSFSNTCEIASFISLFLSQMSAEYCCFYLVLLICKYCILRRCRLRWKSFFSSVLPIMLCSYFL